MSGTEDQERAARLAAALRENLKRRKAQARERKDVPACDERPSGPVPDDDGSSGH